MKIVIEEMNKFQPKNLSKKAKCTFIKKNTFIQSRLELINKSRKLEKFEKVTDNLSSYNAKTGQCKTVLIKRKKYAISPRLKEQKAIINQFEEKK